MTPETVIFVFPSSSDSSPLKTICYVEILENNWINLHCEPFFKLSQRPQKVIIKSKPYNIMGFNSLTNDLLLAES